MEKIFYRTEKGDTIARICDRFGVSPFSVIKLNNLRHEPEEGDLMLIQKISGRKYKVKPFDSVKGISEKTHTPEEKILSQLNDGYLFVGLTLYL